MKKKYITPNIEGIKDVDLYENLMAVSGPANGIYDLGKGGSGQAPSGDQRDQKDVGTSDGDALAKISWDCWEDDEYDDF